MMTVKARLDRKTGRRVLCGFAGNTCPGELAAISAVGRPGPGQIRRLIIRPGWTRDAAGVWYLTKVAQARLARGREVGFRRRWVRTYTDQSPQAFSVSVFPHLTT
jgi:hypothetical protein